MPQLQSRQRNDFEPTGARDGGHHFFECSNCGAPLADVWVTYPDADVTWNMAAECCHCGDKSYEQTVQGMFAIGGTEESMKYTNVEGYDDQSDPIIIKTSKVQDYES